MFSKPNDDTTTALAHLARGAEWEKFEAYLAKCREDCVMLSLSDNDVISRQAQGGIKAIDELLKNTRAAVNLTRR